MKNVNFCELCKRPMGKNQSTQMLNEMFQATPEDQYESHVFSHRALSEAL